jgi:YegS/Rv2252/BmrU family lipid kinase
MRVLLVHNPRAGRSTQATQLADAVAVLQAGGWTVHEAGSEALDNARCLAQEAARRGFDVVVAAGGDGTINQVVDGLMTADRSPGSMPALGILPAGTANVLARDLGLPVPGPGQRDTLVKAARLLLASTPRQVDVGLAHNDRGSCHFACWAGVGIDAAITAHVEANPQLKQRMGPLFFAASALLHAQQVLEPPEYRLQVDGDRWQGRGLLAVASNIKNYAIMFDMAPSALLDDGLLDFAFFTSADPFSMVKTLWLLRTGQHMAEPGVRAARCRRVTIETDPPQHVHLDAEPFGQTPVAIEVVARGLRLLIPPLAKAEGLVHAA